MGFLNHATNNIIIDAVLTDKGREYLARNDGSFQINKFVLCDDEVDYTIIEQYGIPLGKEKIEKNTPIFEAVTSTNLAVKYPLITLSNDTNKVFAYPSVSLDSTATPVIVSTATNASSGSTTKVIKIKTTIDQDTDFDLKKAKLVDDYFKVKVFNKLLKLSGSEGIENTEKEITTYRVSASSLTDTADFTGQVSAEFKITALGVVTDSTYNTYSKSSDRTIIKTEIQIIGNRTNSVLIVPVTITSSLTTA
jgi:hypothetical protein